MRQVPRRDTPAIIGPHNLPHRCPIIERGSENQESRLNSFSPILCDVSSGSPAAGSGEAAGIFVAAIAINFAAL